MIDLNKKRLLILGGTYQHIKIVEAAHSMGIITYVLDYLDKKHSPAKMISDYSFEIDIFDVNQILKLCRENHIDGVVGPYLDPVQKPYYEICSQMGYPCFGNAEQHNILTDKKLFKQFVAKHGGNIIKSYNVDSTYASLEFPVLVKPCDSRGSRGQKICYNQFELEEAVKYSYEYSKTHDVMIEKYMGKENDCQIVYVVINGEPVLYRIGDRYLGEEEYGMDKVCIAEICPSKKLNRYKNALFEKVEKVIKALQLYNAPVFLQSFIEEDKVLMYDPGLRFPGDEYDLVYKKISRVDFPKAFVYFALTGEFPSSLYRDIKNFSFNKITAMLLPNLRPGVIAIIEGIDAVNSIEGVITSNWFFLEGDTVFETHDVRQRFCEIVIEADNVEQMKRIIDRVNDSIKVFDNYGNDMVISKFDSKILNRYL